VALEKILDDGPSKGSEDVHSPVLGHTAVFSANWKALRKRDAPEVRVDEPLPFLFDGREMEQGRRTRVGYLLSYGAVI
jgi:hypothetical protein